MRVRKLLTIWSIILTSLSCVQKTQPKTITLIVDMSTIKNVKTVGVRGSNLPLSWKETLFLDDKNNDGTYKTTLNLNTANYDIEFKFIKNDSIFELEKQNNRNIVFEYKPESIIYKTSFNNPESKTSKK